MRRFLCPLSLSVLAAAGCFLPGSIPDRRAAGQSPALVRQAPPVTPDQVTPENAPQKLQALQEEIEGAQRDLPSGTIGEGSAAGRASR